jgi:hypothetical protein
MLRATRSSQNRASCSRGQFGGLLETYFCRQRGLIGGLPEQHFAFDAEQLGGVPPVPALAVGRHRIVQGNASLVELACPGER